MWRMETGNKPDIFIQNGVSKKILQDGSGDGMPRTGDEVTIHYIGCLADGTQFDSTRERDERFTFKLDDGRVVKGLDVGVSTMRLGEISQLTCQPDYAYGKKGLPPAIPPDATLVFEVELVGWKGEDLTAACDGGILRSILTKGTGHSTPNHGASVNVCVKGCHLSRTFDDRELSFRIGEGLDHGIVTGIERAIKKFKKGETSTLVLSPKYAFGDAGSDTYGIPGNVAVTYEVHLTDFTRAKEQWELTPAEKIGMADQLKSKGTFLYKSDEVLKALSNYTKARDTLDDSPNYSEEELDAKSSLLLSLNLNCALCQLKLEQWNDAINSCNRVLTIESQNEKALFRKAQAYLARKDYSEAINGFEQVLNVYPSNKAARSSLLAVKEQVKKDSTTIKERYNGMFQKFADKDSQKEALEKAKGAMSTEPIGYWSNDMAEGMMSLQQEMEAFGERMPDRSRRSSNGSDSSPRQG